MDAAAGLLRSFERADATLALASSRLSSEADGIEARLQPARLLKRLAAIDKEKKVKLKKMEELAASSLRAGPLAFVSFHLPCLRACVSGFAISMVEQAEMKRQYDAGRAEEAEYALKEQIGTWEKGQFTKALLDVDVEALKAAIHDAAREGLPQELIERGRFKLVAIDKYKKDKERAAAAQEAAVAAAKQPQPIIFFRDGSRSRRAAAARWKAAAATQGAAAAKQRAEAAT